jgi:2-dehydropantoate 2-reductase
VNPPEAVPTLVAGAGAIGGFIAARLAYAGHPVQVLARGETARALRDGPLRVRDGEEELAVRLPVVEDPARARPAGLVVVAVKSFDTETVARTLASAVTPGTPVLSLQNGVDNPAVLAEALPGSPVGGVATYLGCQRIAPDTVVRRPSRDPGTGALRDLLAGGGPGILSERLAMIGAATGVPVRAMDDPRAALWTKLVANASLNTVTALGRVRVGALFANDEAAELMRRIGREVVAVARAAGIDVPPDAAEHYVADARRRLPAGGGSSTLFDLEAGRRLERDALIGAVVRHGDRLGVPVPVSRVCAALLELADPWQEGARSA